MGPTACSHPQPQQHSEPLQPHPGGLQGGHSARPRVWVERQQKKQLSMGVSLLGGTRAGGPRRAATDTGGGQRVGQSRRDVVGPVGQVGAQTPAAQRDTQLGAAGRDGCGIKQGPCSSNTAETTPSHCQNTATPPHNLRKGVQTPIPHPYPTAPSTAMASAAPRLARMAAMTTAVLLRRAGVGSMVLRLRAGRAQGEGWHPGLGWHGDIGELFSPSVLGWRHGGHSPTPSGTSPQEDGVGPLRLRFGATAAHQQELHPAGWAPLAPVRGRHDAPSHCLTCRAPGRAAAHCRVPGRGTPCPRRPAARLHRELSIRRRLPPSAVSCRRGRWAAPRMGAPRRWMWGF